MISQSRMDAMNDAATFRCFLREGVTKEMEQRASGLGAKHIAFFAVFGEWGIDAHGDDREGEAFLKLRFPAASAELRARAAFRACPGLRG